MTNVFRNRCNHFDWNYLPSLLIIPQQCAGFCLSLVWNRWGPASFFTTSVTIGAFGFFAGRTVAAAPALRGMNRASLPPGSIAFEAFSRSRVKSGFRSCRNHCHFLGLSLHLVLLWNTNPWNPSFFKRNLSFSTSFFSGPLFHANWLLIGDFRPGFLLVDVRIYG